MGVNLCALVNVLCELAINLSQPVTTAITEGIYIHAAAAVLVVYSYRRVQQPAGQPAYPPPFYRRIHLRGFYWLDVFDCRQEVPIPPLYRYTRLRTMYMAHSAHTDANTTSPHHQHRHYYSAWWPTRTQKSPMCTASALHHMPWTLAMNNVQYNTCI